MSTQVASNLFEYIKLFEISPVQIIVQKSFKEKCSMVQFSF